MSIRSLHHLIIITIMLSIAIAEIQETESTNYIVVGLKEMAFMPMHTIVDAVPVYFYTHVVAMQSCIAMYYQL